jgi:hypothetical protein
MYDLDDFRASCSKAKQVIVSRHERKNVLDLWTALPREAKQEDQSIVQLKKALNDAMEMESITQDKLWWANNNQEKAILSYNKKKNKLDEKERIMNEMMESRKSADKAYVAAKKAREDAKKALEDAQTAPKPQNDPCSLPITTDSFKKLNKCVATLPAGTYYIGDPCYPLGKSWIYKKAWDAVGYAAPAYFRSDRGVLVVDYTTHGDGSYHTEHDYKDEKVDEYLVDSGTISIISHELIIDEVKRLALEEKPRTTFESLIRGGHMHSFKEEVEIFFEGGEFQIYSGHRGFTINTDYCKTCSEETDDEDM